MYVSHKIKHFHKRTLLAFRWEFSTNFIFKVLYYLTLFWKLANYWTKLSNFFLFLIVSKEKQIFDLKKQTEVTEFF